MPECHAGTAPAYDAGTSIRSRAPTEPWRHRRGPSQGTQTPEDAGPLVMDHPGLILPSSTQAAGGGLSTRRAPNVAEGRIRSWRFEPAAARECRAPLEIAATCSTPGEMLDQATSSRQANGHAVANLATSRRTATTSCNGHHRAGDSGYGQRANGRRGHRTVCEALGTGRASRCSAFGKRRPPGCGWHTAGSHPNKVARWS